MTMVMTMWMWMIGVASPMPLAPPTTMTMAMIRSEWPHPWRWFASPRIWSECYFVLFLLREAGSDVRREREEIKTRSERREKAKYKTLFRFTTSVRTVAKSTHNRYGICAKRYGHKWYNFGTYATYDGSCFLCLAWDMCQIFSIWHISHIYCECSNTLRLY